MKPIIYDKFETNFNHLGLGVLTNALECTVTEERNGAFYLELSSAYDDRLKEGNIIKADTGELKAQRFVIKRTVDNENGTTNVYAVHCSYLASELTFRPHVKAQGITAQQALELWKANILESNPFTVYSDFVGVSSVNWNIDNVENPRRVLGGASGSILQQWGGEYRFNNYHIEYLLNRGVQSNTLLAYGRNIIGIEYEVDISEVYTSIYPFAKYTPEGDNQDEVLVTVNGLVVDVPNIADYPNRRTLVVDFSDKFSDGEIPSKSKLELLAQTYIEENEVGTPKLNAKVDFIELGNTADFARYKDLESVNLCDTVRVFYTPLNLQLTAKVIRTQWDVLQGRYIEIELGNFKRTLSEMLNRKNVAYVNEKVSDVTNVLVGQSVAIKEKNRVFRQEEEPQSAEINDLWLFSNELKVFDGENWQVQTIKSKRHEEVVELNSETAKTITLPIEFKNKDFRVTLSIYDTLDTTKTTKQIVLKQTAQSIGNGTVEIVGYKKMNDDSIEAIQAMLIAEY